MNEFGHAEVPQTSIQSPLSGSGPATADQQADVVPLTNGSVEPSELPSTLEIRQIAGLTAGTVLPLDRGTFHFRNGSDAVRFSLLVESRTRVMVSPGEGFLRINNEEISGPTRLGNGVLDVGNARFIVRQRSAERRLTGKELFDESQSVITVPTFDRSLTEQASPDAPPRKKGLFGLKSGRWADPDQDVDPLLTMKLGQQENNAQRPKGFLGEFRTGRWADEDAMPALDGTSWEFMEDIREARIEQAEQHRAVHPHPEEIQYRLRSGAQGLWNREPHHSLFGRVSVAYADLGWTPLFDNPEGIPESLRPYIARLSNLPSVPITANLPIGPLGIIGYRPSALAVARQVLLALGTTTKPETFEFGVFANDNFVADWEWVNRLPQQFFAPTSQSQPFIFTDGRIGYERASDVHPISKREVGLIVLAETVDGLPPDCGTVVQVDEHGACRVSNHLGEMVDSTPLGVTEEFAATLADTINDTVR